ncbi:MAG TPA: flagella basal body P-ring formation protein FlgA, partial [Labilithrix sp.]|nr:flagella basal body P-ring formation protein FlgA [Labilithrix sp.]
EGVDPTRIPRGVTITAVRAVALPVPDGFDKVTVDLPTMPRRAGTVTVTAAVAFVAQGDVVARMTVPVDFAVTAEALVPDVAKGAAITLLVRRGLVEVSIGAVAGADGDLGGILPILLKPSGRVVRARVIDKDHAVSIEES